MFFYAIQELVTSGETYFEIYLNEGQSESKTYAKFLGCYNSTKSVYYLIPGVTCKTVVEYYEKQNMKGKYISGCRTPTKDK